MTGAAPDFGPFDGRVWLNTAHQGALPAVAAEAAAEAIQWKRDPRHLTDARFAEVPARLRRALGRVLEVPAKEVVLSNSSSYGLHLLANGIPWEAGDEVLLVRGDFPSTTLPWLGLERRGVTVRFIDPEGPVVSTADLGRHLRPATRLFCTTWVHSFTGYAVDARALGELCRSAGTLFVLNASQAVGARRARLGSVPVDAVTGVGFKWLCGPYGTGFCWVRPDLVEELEQNRAYWLTMQSAAELESEREPTFREMPGAPKYDVFGTANFFNFVPWAASLEYLLERGLDVVEAYDAGLVERIVTGIDPDRFRLLSPASGPERSTLIFLSHRKPGRNAAVRDRLRAAGIEVALRRGRLRISPHLHNTEEEVDRFLAAIAD